MHLLMNSSERSHHQKKTTQRMVLFPERKRKSCDFKEPSKVQGEGERIQYNEVEKFMKLRGHTLRKISHCMKAPQRKGENSYLIRGKGIKMAVSRRDALLGPVNPPQGFLVTHCTSKLGIYLQRGKETRKQQK